jgi:hypothetical protein
VQLWQAGEVYACFKAGFSVVKCQTTVHTNETPGLRNHTCAAAAALPRHLRRRHIAAVCAVTPAAAEARQALLPRLPPPRRRSAAIPPVLACSKSCTVLGCGAECAAVLACIMCSNSDE